MVQGEFGWINDQQAVWSVMRQMEANGEKPLFVDAAQHLMMAADDNASVFFWDAEQKVLGKILKSWDQRDAGVCVSFGWGRGVNDLMLLEIASGEPEVYEAPVATEPIYGGSRIEVGKGRAGSGDGSVGAWAAKWVKDWGIILRKKYGQYDLTQYSIPISRQWGASGVPTELETLAKQHPVTAVAMVRTGDEAWVAIGAGKPIPICSNQGFTTVMNGGFCEPSGVWNHCLLLRGRFISPTRGKSFVIQNSWTPSYLRGDNKIETEDRGIIELPEGCFATTIEVIDRIVRQQDSFGIAGLKGWETVRVDHTI